MPVLSFGTLRLNMIFDHSASRNLKATYTFYGHRGILTLVFMRQMG